VDRIEDDQLAGTMPNPATFVSAVIAATKSENPNLGFGVTIYEDGLTHAVLTNAVLPAALRAQIQFVHLCVHYREDAPNFAPTWQQRKPFFRTPRLLPAHIRATELIICLAPIRHRGVYSGSRAVSLQGVIADSNELAE
jgi:hypothetical protein